MFACFQVNINLSLNVLSKLISAINVCTGSFYVSLIPATVILEVGPSSEKIPPSYWPVGKPVLHFLD